MPGWFGPVRWVAVWVVLAVVAPTSARAQDEEKPNPRPSARFKAAKAKAAKSAKSNAKSDEKDEKADDEAAMEDKESGDAEEAKEEGEEFGGARKDRPTKAPAKSATKAAATKKTREKSTTKDKEEKLSKDERDKAKRIKSIERMLGDEKEGFFVLRVSESKWVEKKLEAPPGGGAPPAVGGQPGGQQNQFPYEESVDAKFHVISGRQKAAEFVDDFMGDQAKPAKKSKTKRKARAEEQETFELPPPVRDWEALGWFPTGAEGNVAAQELRDQAKQRYEQQWSKK